MRLRLLAADPRCGYAVNGDAPVQAGVCRLDARPIGVPPYGAARQTITVWRNLPGLSPLAAARYVFRKPMRFRIGEIGAAHRAHDVQVRISYRLARRSAEFGAAGRR
jgi:hypothetical protein